MLILITCLPLFSFFSGIIFGRFIGLGVCLITTTSVFTSFLLSCIFFFNLLKTGATSQTAVLTWIFSDSLQINWCFCYDSLTAIMLIVVTFISTLVHLYSIEYMKEDPHLFRFMSYLSLFTFFMLILVTSANFLQLFVGWEGVGLSSYLLINFWFTRIQANKSSIKAMLLNRVGDFFLLLAIFTILFIADSLDFDVVFSLPILIQNYEILIGSYQISIIDIMCLFIFFGAVGKSAQLGLHTWLPDAMEGPTPVSALIHAATMVTAGVFLIIRCSFLFEFSPNILAVVTILGALTAFFAATTGLFQNDIKRVIAYSTCSQLGYMVFSCGLSCYDVALFHLFNHAFFKALLFLSAGSVIHAIGDEQDMRKMGGLRRLLPFSYAAFLIGSLALTGFPFLAGFYSKDIILEVAYAKSTNNAFFAYTLGVLTAFCTSFYSFRLLFLVFLVQPNGPRKSILNAHEGTWKLTVPLFVLIILSITVGFLFREIFIGFGTTFWLNSIFILPQNYILLDVEFIPLFYKLLPLILTFLGAFLAIYIYFLGIYYYFDIKKTATFLSIYTFLNRKWFFDKIINNFVVKTIFYFSFDFFYKDMDRGFVEKIGPFGIINIIKNTSFLIKTYQNGYVYNYLFVLVFLIYILVILYTISMTSLLTVSLFLLLLFFIYDDEI